MARVVVFGSLNVDTITQVDSLPQPGETIRAQARATSAGGKGLNQAVAAARMGGDTVMVGALGNDDHGHFLRDALANEENLDAAHVRAVGTETGEALVTVEASSENTIIILAGANGAHSPHTARANLSFLTPGDVLVCQLEIPTDAVAAALRTGKARGAITVLNAAPAAPIGEFLADIDVLVVNETEAEIVAAEVLKATGDEAEQSSAAQNPPAQLSPAQIAQGLHESIGASVVVTLGSQGTYYYSSTGAGEIPAFPITAVDTTGAGDAFVGALAAKLSEGAELSTALRFASALGALACEQPGAQGYVARRTEVDALAGA